MVALKRALVGLLAGTITAWPQKPAISPGGVVNAASFTAVTNPATTTALSGPALAPGSIASIFGMNLATSRQTAATVPLPRQLAGTSVSVDGIAAPLFYVSPTQINFQIPSPLDTTPGISTAPGVVVGTAAGLSDPYALQSAADANGVFTRNGSGCSQADVLNVDADGSVSPNSPANSASPGDFISIYGTGAGIAFSAPPDGVPAPSQPLATASTVPVPLYDFAAGSSSPYWAGRAPGLIGVDQFNFVLPSTVREGCAVPLQILAENISQPATISIARGGGPCVDPPQAGFGQIIWEETVTTSATSMVTESDTVTGSFQASPGSKPPVPPVYTKGGQTPIARIYVGGACPVPGYRSLGAGTLTVKGPGFGPADAPVVPLQSYTELDSPAVFNGPVTVYPTAQVSGLTVYQAVLPGGAINAGSFTVAASGGADVGAFQSTVQIGSPIKVTTPLAGSVIQAGAPFTLTWTGGDPNSWVIVTAADPPGGPYMYYANGFVARASDGSLTIDNPTGLPPTFGALGLVDMVVQVIPDPSKVPVFSAPGLSLGGQSLWRYTYIFQGVTLQD
jgi:uncharacterized protein (TIGR03437 family)